MLSDHVVPRTRISIPRRRDDLITRPRLLELIQEACENKLILVTAPAGYGKTSLLVDFAVQSPYAVCWYTVNNLDYELQRFLLNLVSALMIRFPHFGQQTISILKSIKGTIDVDYIANVLVNDLYENVPEHFILVLDDYYLVNDCTQIRNFMARFIQDVDENCHIILTSRNLLSMPVFTTLAARSDIAGLSLEDLAFTEDEVRQFFIQNQQRELTDAEIKDVVYKTEGWVTGIILSSQFKQEQINGRFRSPRVPGVGVEDFFLQLINQQPKEIRDFLLWSSLLEEFNVERCENVLGKALQTEHINWNKVVDQIRHENLFILMVGEDGSWLRYHPLFYNFLRSQIEQETPELARSIEQELARYHQEQGDWDSAFAILRKLNLVEDLAQLIENTGPELMATGRLSTVSTWLDTLPIDLLATRPMLVSLQGFIASTTGDVKLALSLYDQAISIMHLPNDRQAMASALVWRAGTNRMMGNLTSAIIDAQETLRLVETDPSMGKLRAEALRCIGLCLDRQGKSLEALDWINQALLVSLSMKDLDNAAMIQLALGVVNENIGNYAQSMDMYQKALDHWQKTGNIIWLANVLNNLGVLKHITGDYKAAITSYEQALQYARKTGYARFEAFVLTGIGDIYIELNAMDEAENAYEQARLITQRLNIINLQIYIDVQEAVIACARGNIQESYRLINQAREIATRENMIKEIHMCDLEYGAVKVKEGKPQEAINLLEQSCSYYETCGQKIQKEKAHLYLTLAYGQLGQKEKLIEHLLAVLACLNDEYKPTLLIAAANRYYDQLVTLRGIDFVEVQIEELIQNITNFWNQLPELRQYLRQHTLAVPFAPPFLNIRALGKMQVKVNKQLVTNSDFQTQAARDLFFLLLAHPEGITKEEIGEIFWPDADPKDIKFRMKNTLYRLRHAVGKEVIILDQDNYRFNNAVDYEYDVELFLKENALGLNAKDPLQKLAHFREAVKLYKGVFLPEISDTWVYSARESLQQICINILLQTAEIYLDMGNFTLAIEYCQRALDVDNCLELAYRLSFRIYAAMGDQAAMARQYARCCEVLSREINTQPSPQTQMLYQDLLK